MWFVNNIWLFILVVILAPLVYPELKVKPLAPITGNPIGIEDEAYLAHFSKESKYLYFIIGDKKKAGLNFT